MALMPEDAVFLALRPRITVSGAMCLNALFIWITVTPFPNPLDREQKNISQISFRCLQLRFWHRSTGCTQLSSFPFKQMMGGQFYSSYRGKIDFSLWYNHWPSLTRLRWLKRETSYARPPHAAYVLQYNMGTIPKMHYNKSGMTLCPTKVAIRTFGWGKMT